MKIKKISLLLICILSVGTIQAQPFIHPGLLQSRDDIERIRKAMAEKTEPAYTAFMAFSSHPQSKHDYLQHIPLSTIGRNPTIGQSDYDADANAAYQNAMMWVITGDRRHAQKAEAIIDSWASTLKEINGKDAVLMAGLGPFKMVNAAELLRYTDNLWPIQNIKQAENHFRKVIYPILKDFAPFANGNWDGAALKTMLAIAVFTDDRPMFDRALNYYTHGDGDGCITNYIINKTGQCQESGRDQSHTQLGLAHLADCCEIAWHQGLDLYSFADNRLLKGFEYTACYNQGNKVPFQYTLDRTGKYAQTKISEEARGRLRPIYEEVYNHFVNRRKMEAPYTASAAAKLRPENMAPGADHMGFGTLLYTTMDYGNELNKLLPPSAVYARSENSNIIVEWIPVRAATKYVVTRSDETGKIKVFTDVKYSHFVDASVKKGYLYRYSVRSISQRSSTSSFSTVICAGLPKKWFFAQFGKSKPKGSVQYDGKMFSLDATGNDRDSLRSDFTWLFRRFSGDAVLTARFVPQSSSQFLSFGIRIQSTTTDTVNNIDFIIKPIFSGNLEVPDWSVQLYDTNSAGIVHKRTSVLLDKPAVTWGRLTGNVSLMLKKVGTTVSAFFSYNGQNWYPCGSIQSRLGSELTWGLRASSDIADVKTLVKFDHVNLATCK